MTSLIYQSGKPWNRTEVSWAERTLILVLLKWPTLEGPNPTLQNRALEGLVHQLFHARIQLVPLKRQYLWAKPQLSFTVDLFTSWKSLQVSPPPFCVSPIAKQNLLSLSFSLSFSSYEMLLSRNLFTFQWIGLASFEFSLFSQLLGIDRLLWCCFDLSPVLIFDISI